MTFTVDAFTFGGIAVITAMLAVTVRQYRPELAMQIGIAGGAVMLLLALGSLGGVFDAVRPFFEQSGLESGWAAMFLKITGIAYITQISSELCRDAGEGALACKAELCGRLLIVGAAAPAAVKLLQTLAELLSSVR